MTDIVERLGNLIECEVDRAQCELYATAKAEIEQLQAERDLWRERTEQGSLIIEGNVAEIERLTADLEAAARLREQIMREMREDNDRLRAALRGLLADHEDFFGKEVGGWKSAEEARRALEPKP